MAAKTQTLKDLYVDELKDLFDAENRIVKALPKMAKNATSEELRSGFEEHLEQTKEHVNRLKQILTDLGEKGGKKCPGIMGILEEGDEMMGEDFEGSLMDAALISGAQRVEHYEIAAYGCVKAWAELLGESEAIQLLGKTLEEEKETDEKLTQLAETINEQAHSESSEEGEEEEGEESEGRENGRGKAAKVSAKANAARSRTATA
jgi:ferritin-like metal-binding protein YciE